MNLLIILYILFFFKIDFGILKMILRKFGNLYILLNFKIFDLKYYE